MRSEIIKSIKKSDKPDRWRLTFESGRYCWIDKEMKELLEKSFDDPGGKAIKYHLNNMRFMYFFKKDEKTI